MGASRLVSFVDKYHLQDQVKGDEMGRACRKHEEKK
jgi:hypothetical protein